MSDQEDWVRSRGCHRCGVAVNHVHVTQLCFQCVEEYSDHIIADLNKQLATSERLYVELCSRSDLIGNQNVQSALALAAANERIADLQAGSYDYISIDVALDIVFETMALYQVDAGPGMESEFNTALSRALSKAAATRS